MSLAAGGSKGRPADLFIRAITAVADMGRLDNTLIIYIDGDNGTSPERIAASPGVDLPAMGSVD